ncbi:MAG TPA: tripartite tricarboxylate transporter substrate binding protein [Xanthobacteraceae bacterium]|nr:tripartite tricarboxylate transporter substrate binding protein [Xanthobacteraceae bacterium]
MKLHRRELLGLAAGGALAALPRNAAALDFPGRPVHIIAPYPPGAGPDVVARLIAQWLSQRLGEQVIVDNRPGAASNIGTERAAKSPPDGYTLLIAVLTNAVNQTLYTNLNFDFRNDFVPVAGIAKVPFIVVVNANFPAKTVPELIAHAKANPGKIDMATNGVGTGSHTAGELFMMMTGVRFTHVPYKGNYLTDLMGGQVPLAFSPLTAVAEYVKDGRVRGLGVSTAARSASLPDVPTIGESVPGYVAEGWYGLTAPKGTPADVIAKLEAATRQSVADPTLRSRMAAIGLEPAAMTTAEFGQFILDEIDKWAKVIKYANIRVN